MLPDPVILQFPFPVEPQEKLKLEFDLTANFQGTKLEKRFSITGKESCARARKSLTFSTISLISSASKERKI